MNKLSKTPKLDGVAYNADTDKDIPAYRPAPGQSANDAAAALGFKLLGRRDSREHAVAAIVDGGMTFFAVKK